MGTFKQSPAIYHTWDNKKVQTFNQVEAGKDIIMWKEKILHNFYPHKSILTNHVLRTHLFILLVLKSQHERVWEKALPLGSGGINGGSVSCLSPSSSFFLSVFELLFLSLSLRFSICYLYIVSFWYYEDRYDEVRKDRVFGRSQPLDLTSTLLFSM